MARTPSAEEIAAYEAATLKRNESKDRALNAYREAIAKAEADLNAAYDAADQQWIDDESGIFEQFNPAAEA